MHTGTVRDRQRPDRLRASTVRTDAKGKIMTRRLRLVRVQWARRYFIWRRADWNRVCSVTNPDLHLVMLMAELGFIAAQTNVMRIVVWLKVVGLMV